MKKFDHYNSEDPILPVPCNLLPVTSYNTRGLEHHSDAVLRYSSRVWDRL